MIPYKINFTLCECIGVLFNGFADWINETMVEYDSHQDSRERIEYYCTDTNASNILLAIIKEFYSSKPNATIVKYAPSLLKIVDIALVLTDDRLNEVVELFINRNWDNYILTYKTDKKIDDIHESELIQPITRFLNNILSILEMTKDRYLKLLDMYQATTTELLAKLVRSSSGSVDNKTFTNLTPQTPADSSEDWFNYVNNAVKNLSTASDTTSEDRDYLIDKINAIQEKYRNVLKDWSNELDRLCWEE